VLPYLRGRSRSEVGFEVELGIGAGGHGVVVDAFSVTIEFGHDAVFSRSAQS
jgi:hypothetical protein